MGRQGYLIIAVIIVTTALFAATRSGSWTSLLVSALVPPLIMFPLLFALSHYWHSRRTPRHRRVSGEAPQNLIDFLALTNPLMFLLLGALNQRDGNERYQQLLRTGPFGMGQRGYLVALILILAPLTLALIIAAVMGQPPKS